MKIAELRNHPFILLVLKDGVSEGDFTSDFMHKTQQQLSDMSLRIASDHLSIIYADQIKKGCEIVLGICNLGLLELCDNSTDKAKEIIKEQGIVYCFRAGWAKYAELKKISPAYFDDISLTTYALGINDTSDIKLMHAEYVKNGYQSAMLVQIYKSIAGVYSANTPYLDEDEDVLKFELQKYLNTAIALLLIDSEKKAFTTVSYLELITYLVDTDFQELDKKIETSIKKFSDELSLPSKIYLQENALLDFTEFKSLIKNPDTVDVYIPEILELPVTLVNELNDDFEGGYDFHQDDDDDLAFLMDDFKL